MIASALLAVIVPMPAAVSTHPAPTCSLTSREDPARIFEQRFSAAGNDIEALWDLYLWADAFGLERETRRCLRKIVQVDPQHRPANEALGHIFYAGRWFPSERRLAEFKREEEKRLAREQGLVEHEGEWVSKDDLPYLKQGLVRDGSGRWISKEELEKIEAGWQRQDLLWIPPDEAENIFKGLWKCGGDWLPLEEADRYHAEIGRWWRIPTDHFVLQTTTQREVAQKAVDLLYLAARDIERILGRLPQERVDVVLLNSPEQYREVSAGASVLGGVATHGISSVHYAFLADVWFDPAKGGFPGAGIAYWDNSTEAGRSYGAHAIRHAAGLSLVEALDPSPKQIERTLRSRSRSFDVKAFYAEKRLPEWFRYGAAVYAERYYIDATVAHGGNPFWTREWSVQNIVSRGGLRPLPEIFSSTFDPADPQDAGKLMNERGLIVAFMIDGEVPALKEAHAELKAKLASGEDLRRVFTQIEQLVKENEPQLRAFAKL